MDVSNLTLDHFIRITFKILFVIFVVLERKLQKMKTLF